MVCLLIEMLEQEKYECNARNTTLLWSAFLFEKKRVDERAVKKSRLCCLRVSIVSFKEFIRIVNLCYLSRVIICCPITIIVI